MKGRCSLVLVLAFSLGSLASDDPVYDIFEKQIELQVLTATEILNVTKGVLDGIKTNTSEAFFKKISANISEAYYKTVAIVNKTADQDCLSDAKFSADNLISDSDDELNSCQQFTQAYEKVQTVEGTSGLEANLTALQTSILAEAKKCTQKDFSSRLACMMRKAGTSIEDLTKIITSNLHKIGGLSLLVQIEYGDCQSKENDKLTERITEITQTVLACNVTST